MDKIKEDFVSFEVAKLLKEKGFDSEDTGDHGGFYSESCYEHGHGVKTQSGQEVGIVYDDLTNSELGHDEYLRPTLQTAMKWLREKGIIITITYTRCSMHILGSQMMFGFNIQNVQGDLLSENTEVAYDSYEQSEMDAIKYTLENLI